MNANELQLNGIYSFCKNTVNGEVMDSRPT